MLVTNLEVNRRSGFTSDTTDRIRNALSIVLFTFRNVCDSYVSRLLLCEARVIELARCNLITLFSAITASSESGRPSEAPATQSSERRATRLCRNIEITLAIGTATSKKSSTITCTAKRVDRLIVLAIRLGKR